MSTPVLYSYFRSSCSFRVRIALNLKEIPFEYKPINLLKGEQRGEEYLAVNPMGEVPALQIDSNLLTQSVSIMEYLEETRPEIPILPRDPVLRAKASRAVRMLTEIITSGIQPVQNLRVLRKHGLEHKMEWGKWAITHGFDAFELLVSKTAGKYCVGDEITMADICLVPQVFNAERFDVDMKKYPTITRIHQALAEHPAFVKAAPAAQPDCPDELKADATK
ncbi:uncharacterized protein MONBRDRAFT_21180 [Monosiga brevicollis MX1]|uniref:Maleylacetoacetate isomerase n=1 Tax=Monosiga brevicollis TaxID=81824 RepID=A9UR86_MONBE|nr:uncharacterized protein MONBRDRAFT_21180 [Monosiga brevicollis MX1]EDQ91880.1 predicted protein [Monosiga brevicollis MX1]|eukprot:XP_001743166.1 hypothetical protein [Monosiga brevicollis MX1]